MSSNEQELGTTKQDDQKLDTPQEIDRAVQSKDISDSIQKNTEITEKQILDDFTTKPVESNKTSEFGDDDEDFNSDEMQLRWEDDDESNIETPNVKESLNQPEDDLQSKSTTSLETPSTSLVSAVKELENALIETNKDSDFINPKEFKDNDGRAKNECIIEEIETNSSKEILDNIDELLETDDVTEIENAPEHSKISNEAPPEILEPSKSDDPIVKDESKISKMDVDSSAFITKDINETQAVTEVTKPVDSISLDDSTDSIDESNILSSTMNDSFMAGEIKFEHGLKKPDMMLEIPTQEIIECLDDFEDSDSDKSDEKDEGVDISRRTPDGDINSKIMDDEIKSVDEKRDENISEHVITAKDHVEKNPNLIVTDVSTNEDLSDNDVEMCDISKKSDIVLKINEPEKQVAMENSEIIEKENTSEIVLKPVDVTADENKDTHVEDTLMEVDEINMPGDELKFLGLDEPSNCNVALKKTEDCVTVKDDSYLSIIEPTGKTDAVINMQATEQDIVTSDKSEQLSIITDMKKIQQTLNIDEVPKKSAPTNNKQETNAHISNEKLEVKDIKLSESRGSNSEMIIIVDKKSECKLPKDSESPANKTAIVMTADSKSSQNEEPSSKSTLDIKSDSDIQNNSNLPNKETTDTPILAQKADLEAPSDSKPPDNVEPMSTESSTVEKTTNCELQNTETTETQILAQNTDSEAQNDSKPSDNVEPMSTESSIVETTNDSVLHSKETTETPILAQNADSEAPKDSIPLDNVKPMSIETSIIEATTNSELQNTETTETPILAQNADSEAPNDSKLSDNLEPISTESPITGTTKPDEKSQKEQSSKAIENITLDQPSTSKESDNTLDQVPDTVDEQQSIKGSENIVPILNQPSSSKEKDNSLGQVPETRDEQKSLKESENIEPLLDQPTTLKDSDNSLDQVPETTDEEQSIKESEQTEPTLDKLSTLKETDNSLDQVPETTDESLKESKNIEPISDQLSTSKESDKSLEQVPDTTDEVPEVEDSLGLLAESSRVVEDDEEVEEDEEVDADDDEDFDPDDESSNQMTAEHSEDSSAQPDKDDGQTDKDDKTPTAEEEEFSFNIADVTTADENDMDVITEETKVSDVITSETEPAPVETVADTDIEKEPDVLEQVADIETVKLSDTSDNETEEATSILKELLTNPDVPPVNKLSETVVDLEGSSSEDDIQEVNKIKEEEVSSDVKKEEKLIPQNDVKTEATKSVKKDTEPKEDKATTGGFQTALREKMASLLSKITVMTKPGKPDSSTEVFNLDSDDDVPAVANEVTIYEKPESNKCINPVCPSGARAQYVPADVAARAYFDANKNKKYRVCVACAAAVAERTKGLVNGIKELTPLLQLDLRKVSSETVEISDSDSDDGEGDVKPEILGESGVKFLEENLADVINETWIKYKLDERLSSAQSELDDELRKLEADSKEIDTMLNECQIATDLLRNQLYATFEPERRELSAICIVDTPLEKYSFVENASATPEKNLKRRMSTINEQPAKRPAIPLGYTPLDTDDSKTTNVDPSNDDDKDVSVVKLSAEAAPSDLPPPGEITRPVLKTGMSVFAMRNSFCTWLPGKIIDVHPKNPANAFTMCRVRFEIRTKIATRVLSARCLAYLDPADVRLTIGTRVIALSKENAKLDESNKIKKSFYSGIVAEIPNPVNNYRYLIFFDHGYAQYVQHRDTRVVCESSSLVWEEVHPNSREFVKQYLVAYPERPMVRLHAGQRLKTEWNGKWWVTKVLQVDASLVEVSFEDNRTEWIYRGSTRLAPLFLELQAAERQRARPLPRSNQRRMNMPYVEYTRSEEQNRVEAAEQARQQQQSDELRRQRSVAKKSTALPIPAAAPPHPAGPHPNLDGVTSRVVYYTPKNAVKPYKMTTHTCSPSCKRTDVLSLKELRTYNPLAKPLLSGWERQVIRYKGNKEVMYRAPCGRRVRNLKELHDYLRLVQADMGVDLFDFGPNTHCLAEFVLNKCLVGKKDLSHGKENVPVPCVNYYDESLPEFCSYNTERTPTAGVPLNLDPEFLCGCDCTDDCQDKSKCACWKMTLEGARTIGLDHNVGYEYKRLPEPLPSGIYECNSRCKCKHTCLNRVAQHPLQLKLQVFKTLNRGWGIRALNDVPKGAFLCVYAGNLLTDATANLDGLNEGDEYLAELDYIEVVEQMKEGYEEDIPNEDKKLDKKASESSEEETSSEEEEVTTKDDKEDDDFLPGFIGLGVSEFSKRLRKRDRAKKNEDQKEKEKGKEIDKGMEDDGCITISDDEEAKEPAKFMAQSGIGANGFVSKYKSVRTLYGKDEACYIMDAKVQGNIGRYLNHSCTPNVFVQNVFVDSHDPRFPWVAFFALSHIRAGTELTWNYNYDVGSVPGKVLYCYCGAPNCRGRLL